MNSLNFKYKGNVLFENNRQITQNVAEFFSFARILPPIKKM